MFDKKILIVDDEPDVREILGRYLTRKGYKNVMTAAKADEALAKIGQEKPDLILLDVDLKDHIDGVEILKKTKEGVSPASMVVMISGHQDLHEENCKKLGAIDFWGKPLFPDQMAAGIGKIFGAG